MDGLDRKYRSKARMGHAIIKYKRDRRFMCMNTYVSIEISIELFYNISCQVTCIPLACNPHRTIVVPWNYVEGTCVACAWFHRDWVNGDVYFGNSMSPKVTLMLPDLLLPMYVFIWGPV